MNRINLAMSAIALLASLAIPSSGALAQFATDVQCVQCVGTGDIAFGAVRQGRIADGAVTNRKIAFGAVREARIADGAVTNRKIGPGAVREGRIANRAVTTPKIALGAVVEGRLANGAVATNKIRDGAVTTAKIAAGAVSDAKLAADAVTSAKILDGTIVNADISDGAVSAATLGLANTIFIEDTGTPTDNCTDLLDALTGLTGPAAVVLGPGTYDCGSSLGSCRPRSA